MVATIHYRWDFIGLSTQEKPTPETSDKVVDGSTFYSSDDSKLYVWYKDQWYERKALGEGGGSGSTINVVQTTGESTTDVMSQKAVTDALAGAGGSPVKVLTADDYNWNSQTNSATEPFDCVAAWLLDAGMYITHDSAVKVYYRKSYYAPVSCLFIVGENSQNYGTSVLVFRYQYYSGGIVTLAELNYVASDGTANYRTSIASPIDNLTSTVPTIPLSAKQGKVLNDKITALEARIAALEGN